MARLLIRNGALVRRSGALLSVPAGGAGDCACCGDAAPCTCPLDLADNYTIICPCVSLFEGDFCDGVATWSFQVSRPLPAGVSAPGDAVGDCVWYGESGCGGMYLYLRNDCQWVIPFLADPKPTGPTPEGLYPNYLPDQPWAGGDVEVVEEEEGI
ncbi:MAG: hypothetical protein WD534_12905 [Phycisphaeraceae bacterium]